MYKFRNATVQDELELQFEFGGKKTDLQLNWQSYLSMAMCIPNIIILQLNSLLGHKIKAQPRILTVLVLNILLFIALLTLTKIDSDNWQFEFMIASLFNAVLLAVMEAVFQGALYGVVGKFPPEYIGAVVQGKIKLIQSKKCTFAPLSDTKQRKFCEITVFTKNHTLFLIPRNFLSHKIL